MNASSFFPDETQSFLKHQGLALGIPEGDLTAIQMKKECRLTLVFPAETRQVELIRRLARKTASEIPTVDTDTANDIALALDEACNNVVRHAYGSQEKVGQIEAEIRFSSRDITIILKDEGEGGRLFNPDPFKPLDIQALRQHPKAGGLGLHLIRKIMDEVHYERKEGKQNQLTMKRYLAPRQ